MKKLNNIFVFCTEKSTLDMLQGYCFAININMTVVNFNAHEINKVEKQKPDLILVQVDLVSANNRIETNLLRQVVVRNQLNICFLNTNSNQVISSELPEWINIILNNPFEITEHIKKALQSKANLIGSRRDGERRLIAGRRSTDSNSNFDDGYKATLNRDCRDEVLNPESTHLKINQDSKCLLLNGDQIPLTPKEFELINFLLSDNNRVFMNNEIMHRLWPENHRATKSDLYQYMHLLRKKIEKDPTNPKIILTVRGFGYRLNMA
jgi:DNA-binding response OmpR family regulator